MTTKYYIISADNARTLGVTSFRNGSEEKGYLVNDSDVEYAPGNIRREAREVSVQEAKEFVKNLLK